jgi:hypothetical protein
MVVPIAATEQATAFLAVNTQRQGVSQFSLFKAGLAAGEPWAAEAARAVAAADCRLMSFHPSSANKKPGEVYAVGLVREMVTKGHAPAVTTVLRALRAIETGGSSDLALYSDWLLKPLMTAVAAAPPIDANTLATLLRRKRPFITLENAESLAKSEHRPRAAVAREAFLRQIGDHLAMETHHA